MPNDAVSQDVLMQVVAKQNAVVQSQVFQGTEGECRLYLAGLIRDLRQWGIKFSRLRDMPGVEVVSLSGNVYSYCLVDAS